MVIVGRSRRGSITVATSHVNQQPDNQVRKNNTTKETTEKPDFILLGIDVHLNKYVFRRQVDGQAPQPAQTFRCMEKLLKFIEKQKEQAKEVYCCYEAGPLGYVLHRRIEALGVTNYVVKPKILDEEGKKRKNDKHDALGLVRDLERYVRGNEKALCVIRIPSLGAELQRSESRMRGAWKKDRKRLESRGRGLLLYYGYHYRGKWWNEKNWQEVGEDVPPELSKMLETLRTEIIKIEEIIQKITEAIEAKVIDPLPKGLGKLTSETLDREVVDWERFTKSKQVGSYTGMCPGEDSSGGREKKLSINKHGNPRVRHVLVEAAWRLLMFQPDYGPVKRFKQKFGLAGGKMKAARKKAVVAIGRQFAVDWWKMKTGRACPEDFGLIMMAV